MATNDQNSDCRTDNQSRNYRNETKEVPVYDNSLRDISTIDANQPPKGWKRFFSYKGRIGRLEYWLTYYGSFIFLIPMISIDEIVEKTDDNVIGLLLVLIRLLLSIAWIWMLLATGAKRCHDRGNSGWFQIIPFYGLWMAFAPGDDGPNEYGVRS